jgi:dTDP-4-dehydrorhamnose reductase
MLNDLALPKTAIIGGGGFLGSRLLAAHRRLYPDCIGTYHSQGHPKLDIFAPDLAPLNLVGTGHKEVIVAAAVVDVKRCEWNKEETRPGNVTGTLELLRQISSAGLKPVFISTDWVFRGDTGNYDDEAKPDPICGYGAQKAQVEAALPGVCGPRYLIVRLSKLFSLNKGDKSAPDQFAALLAQGKKVRAARDQVFGPLLVGDAVKAILGLQRAGATGTVNICSSEVWSRLDMAYALADALGADRRLIEPISLDDLGDGIRRPKNTFMICKRLNAVAPVDFTPMSQCIQRIAQNYKP